jgi:hypothetical protein
MATAQLFHHCAPRPEIQVVAKAMIRLLRSHPEVQVCRWARFTAREQVRYRLGDECALISATAQALHSYPVHGLPNVEPPLILLNSFMFTPVTLTEGEGALQ